MENLKTRIWAMGKLWDVEFRRMSSQASDRDEHDIYEAIARSGGIRHWSRWSISGHLRDVMGREYNEASVVAWYVREYQRTAEELLNEENPNRMMLEAQLPAYGPVTSGDPVEFVSREVEDILFALATWTGAASFPSTNHWPVQRSFLKAHPAYEALIEFFDWLSAIRDKNRPTQTDLDEGTSLGLTALQDLRSTTESVRGEEPDTSDELPWEDNRSILGEGREKITVFYSWQSDLPNCTNRNLIQDALERAIRSVNEPRESVNPPLVLDRDTLNVLGSPDIAGTILQKIDESDVIVADVSLVRDPNEQASPVRPSPNPNVLLELGWAAKSLGWPRMICVANLAYGKIEELPFDLRGRRVMTYASRPEDTERAPARNNLAKKFQGALQGVVDALPVRAVQTDGIGSVETAVSTHAAIPPQLSTTEQAALSRFRHHASLGATRLIKDDVDSALAPLREALAIADEFNLAAKGQKTPVLQTTAKFWIALLDAALAMKDRGLFQEARGICDGADTFDEMLGNVDYAAERRYVGKFLFAACAYYFGYEGRAPEELWTEAQERFEIGTDPAYVPEGLQERIRRRWSWTAHFQTWLAAGLEGDLIALVSLRDALGQERNIRIAVNDFLRRSIGFTRDSIDKDRLRKQYEWILQREAHRRHIKDTLILGTDVESVVEERIRGCIRSPSSS
jgi:hypothetical protein